MAALCKHISTEFCLVSRSALAGICINSLRSQAVRCLYTQEALGMDNYMRTRERINSQFRTIGDKFRSKMRDFCEESSTNMIFTEDLKNMSHLVEADQGDVELIVKMIKKYNSQNKNLRFGSYVFGPVVMRTFYYLNEPEVALAAFKDPELNGFFDQIGSFQLLMDLLFNNQMYDEVLEVFEIIKEKQLQGAKYPRNCMVLVFATYYKLNTPESLKLAMDLWSELQEHGHNPIRRAATFAAALALKQNAPHVALEILSTQRNQNYVTVRNLKIWAYAALDRPEDAFPLLRNVLEVDDPEKKITVAKQSVDKLKEAVQRCDRNDLKMEFEQLEKRFIAGGLLDEQDQEVLLCSEIKPRISEKDMNRDGRFVAATFNRQRGPRPQRFSSTPRPGLAQMY